MPGVTGFFLAVGFGALADGDTDDRTGGRPRSPCPRSIRMIAIHHGALIWTEAWIHMQTLLRANLLAAQMASGGPEAGQPVGSAGAAITHFRDDTEDVANFVDGMVDVSGGLVFTVFAGIVLGAADPRRGRRPAAAAGRRRRSRPQRSTTGSRCIAPPTARRPQR